MPPTPTSHCGGTHAGDGPQEALSPKLPQLPGKPPALHPLVLDTIPGTLAPALVAGFLTQILHRAAIPLFSTPPPPKHFLLFPLSPQTVHISVPSRHGPNCTAFPRHFANFGERSQPFPAGSSRSTCLCPGQIAKGLDPVPRRECQGRGDLASHLFFLGTKHAFKSQSRFTGKRWKLLEAASCPSYDSQQGQFPSPALCMFCRHTHGGCISWTPGQPQPGGCIPVGHLTALRPLAPLQSGSSLHPSTPALLLLSREVVFNERVCFRSSIMSFGNASRADGRASPAALPLPMLTPSPHSGVLCALRPSAFRKDVAESAPMQSPPRGQWLPHGRPPPLLDMSQCRVWRAKRSIISTSQISCSRNHQRFL